MTVKIKVEPPVKMVHSSKPLSVPHDSSRKMLLAAVRLQDLMRGIKNVSNQVHFGFVIVGDGTEPSVIGMIGLSSLKVLVKQLGKEIRRYVCLTAK